METVGEMRARAQELLERAARVEALALAPQPGQVWRLMVARAARPEEVEVVGVFEWAEGVFASRRYVVGRIVPSGAQPVVFPVEEFVAYYERTGQRCG